MIYVLIPTTKQRRERFKECFESLRNSVCSEPFTIMIYENLEGGYVPAVRNALSGLDGLVFIVNDDMVVEPDCLQKLFDVYKNYNIPDAVYHPYENIQEGRLIVAPFCHTSVIRPFLEKGYKHMYWDNEFTYVMKSRSKYIFVKEARLRHNHFLRNLASMDETYAISQAHMTPDGELFAKRQANKFKD